MSSSERFGYEWDKYCSMDANYEGQFRNWLAPLTEKDFAGKDVLDVGCGMGRNSYWPLKWGAKSVTAFDFDERSVRRTRETLKQFNNANILYKSVYDIDWADKFDIAFSIGVIHHLERPDIALGNIVRALKPGGTLAIWVYSYEGNRWIVRYVDPVRKMLTSKLPVSLVHILSYACSIPLYLFVKIFCGPSAYFKQLSNFGFRHLHSIVFDQLIPTVANYWRKEEVEKLFAGLPLREYHVYRPANGMGWTAVGKK